MKRRPFIAAGIFLIIAMFLGGIILGQTFTSVRVRAENGDRMFEPTRWEYCSVVPSTAVSTEFGKHSGTVTIYYAKDVADTSEKVEGTLKNGAIDSVVAKAVAKLGAEGWEMVGQGTFLSYERDQAPALYFKRPIR